MGISVVWLIQAAKKYSLSLSLSGTGMTGKIRLQKLQTQIKGALHAQADTGHRTRERESLTDRTQALLALATEV